VVPGDSRLLMRPVIAHQLNGYPARIVVPGWTATYWMKRVTHIEVSSKPLNNFWMQRVTEAQSCRVSQQRATETICDGSLRDCQDSTAPSERSCAWGWMV
jgi:DMSO/TMAO reductase YedYZ molybdopterin-dependent catalytic subunit